MKTIDGNQNTVTHLFEQYKNVGFLYPEKRKMLAPYLSKIKANWESLVQSPDNLLRIHTNGANKEDDFASISVLRNGNHSLMPQHLVSNGNPFLSLQVMLDAQKMAIDSPDLSMITSAQNWFRPGNRYAFRVFASMYDRLGEEKASLKKFQYLHMPLSKIDQTPNDTFVAEVVHGLDAELMSFIRRQMGRVFLRAEELNQKDITLSDLNKKYQPYGMCRSRKILKIRNRLNGRVEGCVVANRAPLGLNFSFLENRVYFILKKNISLTNRFEALHTMMAATISFYEDIAIGALPVVTDEMTSSVLQKMGADYVREYYQSIWLREGFQEWYDHISSFLERIMKRKTAA